MVKLPEIVLPVPFDGIPVNEAVFDLVHEKVVPATLFGLLIRILLIAVPLQRVWVAGVALIVGFGFTIIAADVVVEHPLARAEIENVVVCWVEVLLIRLPLIFEFPVTEIPVRFAVLVLVQLNVVPATLFGFVTRIPVIASPEQIVCRTGEAFTVGKGFIVTTV